MACKTMCHQSYKTNHNEDGNMVTKWKTKENYPRKLQGKTSPMKQIHYDKRSFIILRKTFF